MVEQSGIASVSQDVELDLPATVSFLRALSANAVRRDAIAAMFVAAMTIVAFLPALAGGFIWNDADYVTNPALRSWTGLVRIWTEFGATEQYYPVLHSVFWVQHRLWGDQALGYHLVTLLAHAGCAVLFGVVLRRLVVPGAWLAAALFALHPVHVESVAWIAEQKNTLSLLGYLGAAWAYLVFEASRRSRWYAVATALFILSLLTKTVTATLPAALLVVLWWRQGRIEWRRDWRPLVPWLAMGAAGGLLSSWIERHVGGAGGAEFILSWPERLLLAGRAFWFYLGSLVWPFDLNFIYPRWTPDVRDVSQWLYPLTAVGLVGAGWALRRRTRAPLAAGLFFAGSLFPVLGFVNLYGARYSWVWDHWQYLPDLGPLALAGAGLALGLRRLGGLRRQLTRAAVAALLAVCALGVWQHSRTFRDDETLYRTTVSRNPDAWMAHANLGALLAVDPAHRAEAMDHLTAALRLKPDAAEIHESLGTLLAREPADRAAAGEHFETAIRLDPQRATAHNNLGRLLYQTGETEAAVAAFRQALVHDPRLASAGANLGTVLNALNRSAEALPVLQQALAADPSLAAAHLAQGDALSALSRAAEAERSYREALRLEPHAVDIRVRLAALLLDQGDGAAALPLLQEAIAQDAKSAEAHYHLGRVLLRLGRSGEGIGALRAAVQLRPEWTTARFALGNAHAQMGDMPGAIQEYRAVLASQPRDLRVRNNLANALLAAGDLPGAIREYETALEQQPDNASIRANLDLTREQLRQRTRR